MTLDDAVKRLLKQAEPCPSCMHWDMILLCDRASNPCHDCKHNGEGGTEDHYEREAENMSAGSEVGRPDGAP